MPEIIKQPLSYYVEPILADKPYSFARYGDGEWAAVLGKRTHPQKNCDGHFFFPEMRDEFRWVFRSLRDDPDRFPYLLGMQNMAMNMWSKAIDDFLTSHNLQERAWHNADVFHHASREGQLAPLIEALKAKPVVVVGPPHLRALDRVFGYNEFVQVPHQNCYLQLQRILTQVKQAIATLPKPVVVAISASMPAEILIHKLFGAYGSQAFLLDFGSVFDPYAGVASRKYHQGMSLDDIRTISPGTRLAVAAGSLRGAGPRQVGHRRRSFDPRGN